MVPTILLVVLVIAFLASVGRSAVPAAERLPWTRWTAKDLVGNVVIGYRRLVQLSERDPLTPHKRTPFHS